MTLSSIKADPLNKLKHPGQHRTQPKTCSAAFCSQWPTAYSNCWYHTIGPKEKKNHNWQCTIKKLLIYEIPCSEIKRIYYLLELQWNGLLVLFGKGFFKVRPRKTHLTFKQDPTKPQSFLKVGVVEINTLSRHSLKIKSNFTWKRVTEFWLYLFTWSDWVNSSTYSSNLFVFLHSVNQKTNRFWFEIDISV